MLGSTVGQCWTFKTPVPDSVDGAVHSVSTEGAERPQLVVPLVQATSRRERPCEHLLHRTFLELARTL
eukprot:9335557-Pyramimonas_sp.AAC.1